MNQRLRNPLTVIALVVAAGLAFYLFRPDTLVLDQAVDESLDQAFGATETMRLNGPGVGLLLDVDQEYRSKGAAGTLPTIAPRRFNPNGESWLPILHTERDGWHFTALFSNTARAHELGRTDDWVVVYFYDDHHREGQCTVVTETRGPMIGRRVVRGRESECRKLYAV